MRRIIIMVLANLLYVPYWMIQLCMYARKNDRHTEMERYQLLKKIVLRANKGGKVHIQAEGQEHLPNQDGFIMYPNHQGLYDVLAFIESCDHPFSVVMKKEVSNIPFLKQVFAIMRAKAIDREDIRQGLKVIMEVAKEVSEGRNYIIFAEGTRSKEKNKLQKFKGGSFKAAMRAKCPIVPVAIIDAFKPFDSHSIEETTVKVFYLEPLSYEKYRDMKSVEIAAYVEKKIQEKIDEEILKN